MEGVEFPWFFARVPGGLSLRRKRKRTRIKMENRETDGHRPGRKRVKKVRNFEGRKKKGTPTGGWGRGGEYIVGGGGGGEKAKELKAEREGKIWGYIIKKGV